MCGDSNQGHAASEEGKEAFKKQLSEKDRLNTFRVRRANSFNAFASTANVINRRNAMRSPPLRLAAFASVPN
eukprot:4787614-Pyramimonas_sp.AAC.2